MPPINPPVGQITALGIGKETTIGTAVTPSLFHAHLGWTSGDKNVLVPRLGARKRLGMTFPATGVYETKGSLEIECDPDTMPQILAFALGKQSPPVVAGGSTLAYTTSMTLGNPLPSFTVQVNRVTDAVAYFGCKVTTLAIGMTEKGGMTCKITIDYMGSVLVASPATPTFSTKLPFQFHNPASSFTYKGVQLGTPGSNAVISWDLSVANNLVDSYYSFGNGRFKFAIPEQQRSVTGKAELGFENNAPILDFFGGATGPGNVINGVAIAMASVSTDYADPGTPLIPYSTNFIMANAFLESASPDVKPNGVLTMPLVWQAAESANGAADDLKAVVTNTNSAVY